MSVCFAQEFPVAANRRALQREAPSAQRDASAPRLAAIPQTQLAVYRAAARELRAIAPCSRNRYHAAVCSPYKFASQAMKSRQLAPACALHPQYVQATQATSVPE